MLCVCLHSFIDFLSFCPVIFFQFYCRSLLCVFLFFILFCFFLKLYFSLTLLRNWRHFGFSSPPDLWFWDSRVRVRMNMKQHATVCNLVMR